MKRSSASALLTVALCVAACSGGGSTAPASNTGNTGNTGGTGGTPVPANTVIATSTNVFNPSALTVAPGTTVTFTFESVVHNVIFASGVTGKPADIGNTSNASVTRVFATAGTFNYTCTIHGMQGTVTVH